MPYGIVIVAPTVFVVPRPELKEEGVECGDDVSNPLSTSVGGGAT